jgi:hypothetical protein
MSLMSLNSNTWIQDASLNLMITRTGGPGAPELTANHLLKDTEAHGCITWRNLVMPYGGHQQKFRGASSGVTFSWALPTQSCWSPVAWYWVVFCCLQIHVSESWSQFSTTGQFVFWFLDCFFGDTGLAYRICLQANVASEMVMLSYT